MSEQKKPEKDQWWFTSDMNRRIYIHGVNQNGGIIFETKSGAVCVDVDFSDWHHEPDCTGWEWTKPDWVTQDRVPARPWIDECRPIGTNYKFVEVHAGGDVAGKTLSQLLGQWELRCLRKDLPELPRVVEEWPKYYEAVNTEEFVYARRDSLKEFTPVRSNGKEGWVHRWNETIDGARKELTESEALARLKPAEPVPVVPEKPSDYCAICRYRRPEPESSLCAVCNHDFSPAPLPHDLKIYRADNGDLYSTVSPRHASDRQIHFSSCGWFVVEVGE